MYELDELVVDPVRRVLLRDGEPVAITPKAFSILLALLEKPGEVVEKSDLLEKVWPGAFVTEANLTQNIFSLRKCLGERANDNRYIVTVPGQGYMFAGDLRRRVERSSTSEIPILVEPPAAAPAYPFPTSLPVTPEPFPALPPTGEITIVTPPPAKPAPRWRRALAWTAWTLAAALVIVTAAHILKHLGDPPKASRGSVAAVRQSIAVLDFKSLSPSPDTRWLESAIAEMLTTELAAGGKMRVIRGDTVAQAMRSLALRDPGSLGPADLQRLHDALGADLVVVGSYLPFEGKIRVDLRVLEIPDGDTVTSLAQVGAQTALFDLMSRTGESLRQSLGVTARSEQVREARALRPSNTESSRLYAEGLRALRAFDPPGALRFLQQAVEIDPKSAVIHSALSQTWTALGYDARATEEARKALELAGSLSREERLVIEGQLHRAGKEWSQASETYRSLWTFYPDDVEHGLQLVDCLTMGGRGTEAASTIAALRKLPPPSGQDPRIDVAEAKNSRRLADYATQLRTAQAAAAKARQSGQSLVLAQALIYQGDALVKAGKPQEAIPLFHESGEMAKKAGYQWGMGMALANLGGTYQALGDLDASERANTEALDIAQRLGSGLAIGNQLFALGQLHQARGELSEAFRMLEEAYGWYVRIGDRLLQSSALSSAGEVLCAQGDLSGARQRFERAIALSQTLSNRAHEANALDKLGSVLEAQGELAEARRRHEDAFFLLHRLGDASAAAAALAGSASVSGQLGDLHTAWQRATQALASTRQVGDRLGTGRILGLRAWLAYQMGDLTASRENAQEELQIARQTGARPVSVLALQSLSHTDFAAGDVQKARAELEEALRVCSSLGNELRAMEIRLDLAELALAMNQAPEASQLARQAAAWYREHGIPGGEAKALSLLAEAQLRQGLAKEALAAAEQARGRLDTSEDRELRIVAGVRLARIQAATGHAAEALRQLRRAADEASALGLAAAALEARLALGEAQRGAGDPGAGVTLAAVRKEAETRGFRRVAVAAGPAGSPSLPSVPPRMPVSAG
ncbi:MAG TPA: tetratricopeptide repeat protein [Thermoanaerobaculia bacterium]|nr:tetratricopeptide repeat protein [Thermoanaerobaculia bacterium]